jgi:hypothetical protein
MCRVELQINYNFGTITGCSTIDVDVPENVWPAKTQKQWEEILRMVRAKVESLCTGPVPKYEVIRPPC